MNKISSNKRNVWRQKFRWHNGIDSIPSNDNDRNDIWHKYNIKIMNYCCGGGGRKKHKIMKYASHKNRVIAVSGSKRAKRATSVVGWLHRIMLPLFSHVQPAGISGLLHATSVCGFARTAASTFADHKLHVPSDGQIVKRAACGATLYSVTGAI